MVLRTTDREETRQIVDAWKAENDPLTLAESIDTLKRSGSVHFIHCPFHADHNNPNMAVYADGFHCYACGWHGDQVDFIMAVNQWDFPQFIDFIAAFRTDPRPLHVERKPAAPRERPDLDPDLPAKLVARMGQREFAYWEQQGLPRDIQARFRIGWTGQRYTFPWFYRGVFVACKMRRDDDVTADIEPKYISLKGSRFATPYNIDAMLLGDAPDHVLIAEDEKSVMAAAVYGLTAISSPAGSWKQEWVHLLSRVRSVVILADNDAPGQEHAHRIQATLRRARIMTPDHDKDFFDFHQRLIGIPGTDGLIRDWLGL